MIVVNMQRICQDVLHKKTGDIIVDKKKEENWLFRYDTIKDALNHLFNEMGFLYHVNDGTYIVYSDPDDKVANAIQCIE